MSRLWQSAEGFGTLIVPGTGLTVKTARGGRDLFP